MTCFLLVKIPLPGHRVSFESARSFETGCLFLSESYPFRIFLQEILIRTEQANEGSTYELLQNFRGSRVSMVPGNFTVRAGRLPTSHCVNNTNYCVVVVVGKVSKTPHFYVLFLLNIRKTFF